SDLLLRRWVLPPSRKWRQHSVSVGLGAQRTGGAAAATRGTENVKATRRLGCRVVIATLATEVQTACVCPTSDAGSATWAEPLEVRRLIVSTTTADEQLHR